MDAVYQFPGTMIDPAPRIARRKTSPLRALMDFYESTEGMEGDESEIDLMIQLSGMVGGTALAVEGI